MAVSASRLAVGTAASQVIYTRVVLREAINKLFFIQDALSSRVVSAVKPTVVFPIVHFVNMVFVDRALLLTLCRARAFSLFFVL